MPLRRRTVLLAGTAGLAAAACASDAKEAAQAQIDGIEHAACPPGRGPLLVSIYLSASTRPVSTLNEWFFTELRGTPAWQVGWVKRSGPTRCAPLR
jgi:hypothetical protein